MYSNQPIDVSIMMSSNSLEEGEIQDSIDISNQ